MTASHLLLRNLRFHWRANLGVALGAALAATVLTGALLVGDSVRFSLEQMAHRRLGRADFVLVSPDRLFHADLATRLGEDLATPPAAVLLLEGVALAPEGDRRVNDVQVVGVDASFWALAPQPPEAATLEAGSCVVNAALAERLGIEGPGDAWVLRLRKPGGLPIDMSLATRGADVGSQRLVVARIAEAEAFGDFSLRTSQRSVPTVFLPLDWLGEKLERPGRANVMLMPRGDGVADAAAWTARIEGAWRLEDAGLSLRTLADGVVELRSDRVFIPPAIAEAVRRTTPEANPVVTYFVNRIEAGGRATPYSFASAPGPSRVPETLRPGEVIVNDWLAEDLAVGRGDALTVRYYAVDDGGRLKEQSASFAVADVIPAAVVAEADRTLAPEIPGLSDAINCPDWDPGLAVDLDRIRDKDEAYWSDYGSLPKLYFTQADAERLWRNKFGTFTALRFPASAGNEATVARTLRAGLTAQDAGWMVQAAKEAALAASREAVDFGELFIGLSFFLIASALLLTAVLFAFNVQHRALETGTLRALGFRPRAVAFLLMAEGFVLVVAGAMLGALLAIGYQRLVLHALQTLWRDVVRTSGLQAHVRPASLIAGVVVVVLGALASLAWAIRRQTLATVRDLQQDGSGSDAATRGSSRRAIVVGALLVAGAAAVAAIVPAGQGRAAAGAFFASGFLVLAGSLAALHGALGWLQGTAGTRALDSLHLAVRGAARRRGRSLASVALVALGVFLVVAVAANRRGPPPDPSDPASGTGGYALWATSTLPLVDDLDDPSVRTRLGLGGAEMDGVRFAQLRLREGDDASCLNLNRVTTPPLLGVDPMTFERRGAFTFAQGPADESLKASWSLLDLDLGPDVVPGIANLGDIVWGLGKAVGDTVAYADESGRIYHVKLMAGLAPSILQGHVLIAERQFVRRHPSQGGARALLVEAPPGRDVSALERRLTTRLADAGLACTPTARRLMEFSSVENTYLAIFMLLGGLGVLLGSAGLGVVAARNIVERRAEWALLRAVGFRSRPLRRLVFAEHAALALAGTLLGTLSAAVAVAPALASPEASVPWRGLVLTLAAVLAGSLLWIALACWAATRGPALAALRDE
ncbi:MAG: ABC transporter permease [Lentisphaerae bacterium]|nr:ABC transporter permease [Lentisphaerota bacterium]